MKELQILLRRFLARELSLEELQARFAALLEIDEDLPAAAAAWLDAGEQDGLLSAAICNALKTVLVSHIAATSVAPDPGESGIFGALDEEDDQDRTGGGDETFVRDPEATHLSDDSPQPAAAKEDGDGVLRIGSIVGGRYELVSQLGIGGMGRVYMARDRLREEVQDRNPHVALKVLSEEFKHHPDSMIALQREVRRAQTLAHPNVITVHEFFRDGPHLYMTMELLTGKALDQLLQSEFSGGIDYEHAWPIIESVCHALQYGHKKGIVHSDIKPGNIFVCDDGTVKVFDLGISRPMTPANTPNAEETVFDPGQRLGSLTPAYAALEMWYQDSPDPRDDIYALACVAYVLLSGRHPFDGQSAREAKKLALSPRRIESLTRGQWNALLQGLAFERADRTISVDRFRLQMEPQAVVRRNRRYLAAAVAMVAIIGAFFGAETLTRFAEDRALVDVGLMERPGESQPGDGGNVERPALTAEQQDEIDGLLNLAGMQFSMVSADSAADELTYVLSEGPNNVLQLADTVLQIDPGYEAALDTKQKVFDAFVDKAQQLEDEKRYAKALRFTRDAEAVIPNTPTVLRLRRRICNNAPDACAQE